MKKFISLCLAAILLLSLAACGTDDSQTGDDPSTGNETEARTEITLPLIENPEGREKQYYSEYLLSGNLNIILDETKIAANNLHIYTYLEDLNGDGVQELWLQATDTGTVAEYLYTIYEGRILCLTKTLGSIRGNLSQIILVTDSEGNHYPSVEIVSNLSPQYPQGERTTIVYDLEGAQLTPRLTTTIYSVFSDGSADDVINRVKAENEHYTYTDKEFRWWFANGENVSSDELAQYDLSYMSYHVRTTAGSFRDPLGLNK